MTELYTACDVLNIELEMLELSEQDVTDCVVMLDKIYELIESIESSNEYNNDHND